MHQIQLCDCPKRKTFIYFCIQERCILHRRLCADCFKDHRDHEMILIQNSQSLRSYACNKGNPDIGNILLQLNQTIQATIAIRDKVISQMNKYIEQWTSSFDKNIKNPLQMLKRTSQTALQQEKKSIIYKQKASKEQLSEVALEIRALNKKLFQQKQSIRSMKYHLIESLNNVRNDLFKRLQFETQSKTLQELNPFFLKWNQVLKQQEEKRLHFLKQFGKIIGNYSNLQTSQQWMSKGKNLIQIQKLCFNYKNIETIPEQLKLFPNLKYLEFSKNKIKKISNLQHITKLESLGLNSNQITKLENIDQQTNLKYLDLGNNQITKLTGKNLNQIVKMKVVWLYENPLTGNQGEMKKIEELKKRGVMVKAISRNH